jgi:hypothetical protein
MKANLNLFSRPLFLLCLLLLLVNDFYCKYAFPGILTGKLSDFAGLFIFPYFFSVFFEKQSKYIYIATGLFFMYWKLEMAQPFIDWLSSVAPLGVYRTIDATDLIALLILPLSYQYFKKEVLLPANRNKVFTLFIISISSFSFVATTLQKEMRELNLTSGKGFIIPISEHQYLNQFKEPNKLPIGYDQFYIEDFDTHVYIETEVKEYDKKNTLIVLKAINYTTTTGGLFSAPDQEDSKGMQELTLGDFEKYYEAYLREEFGSVKIIQPK